jgi:hypothetical protein
MNVPSIKKKALNAIKKTHTGIFIDPTHSAKRMGSPSIAINQAKAAAVAMIKVTDAVVTIALKMTSRNFLKVTSL